MILPERFGLGQLVRQHGIWKNFVWGWAMVEEHCLQMATDLWEYVVASWEAVSHLSWRKTFQVSSNLGEWAFPSVNHYEIGMKILSGCGRVISNGMWIPVFHVNDRMEPQLMVQIIWIPDCLLRIF